MMKTKTKILTILGLLLSLPTYANEGGKIMGNAAMGILFFGAIFLVVFLVPIVVILKTSLSRYIGVTVFNLLLYLFLHFTEFGDMILFVLPEPFLVFHIIFQIIATVLYFAYRSKDKEEA